MLLMAFVFWLLAVSPYHYLKDFWLFFSIYVGGLWYIYICGLNQQF